MASSSSSLLHPVINCCCVCVGAQQHSASAIVEVEVREMREVRRCGHISGNNYYYCHGRWSPRPLGRSAGSENQKLIWIMPNKLQQDTEGSSNIPLLYHLWIISTADCPGGLVCRYSVFVWRVMSWWINVSLRGASLVHACHCEMETWGWAWHLSSVSCRHIYILMNYSWWRGDAIWSSCGAAAGNITMQIWIFSPLNTIFRICTVCSTYLLNISIYPIKLSRGKWYKDEICDMTGHHVIRMGTSLSAEICGWIGDTVLQSQHVS